MIKSRINVRLAERDMTQKDLSALTGISQSAISNLHRGVAKQLPFEDLNALCKVFSCQPSDLFVYIEDEEAQ